MRIGIIGGSGMEDRLVEGAGLSGVERHIPGTPFGAPSGPIVTGMARGVPVAVLQRHGPGHLIPPHRVPYRANIFALKMLGVTHLVATGAAGSLREEFRPGDLVVCDQLVDRTEGRERTFFEHAAVHVEFSHPFCPVMRSWLVAAAGRSGVRAHDRGTYVVMNGPAFSTRAESLMHRALGADVVGMTALPEARLAREAEIAYALLALPTDYDCWREHPPGAPPSSLAQEILANLGKATEGAAVTIIAALEGAAVLEATPSPAHAALAGAIWSQKEAIAPQEVAMLAPLWGRYFR